MFVIIIIITTMLFPGAVMMFDLAAPARVQPGYRGMQGDVTSVELEYNQGTLGCRRDIWYKYKYCLAQQIYICIFGTVHFAKLVTAMYFVQPYWLNTFPDMSGTVSVTLQANLPLYTSGQYCEVIFLWSTPIYLWDDKVVLEVCTIPNLRSLLESLIEEDGAKTRKWRPHHQKALVTIYNAQ